MPKFKWIITQDLLCDSKDPDDVSAVGRGNHGGLVGTLPYEFRLRDDDGLIYYYGRSNDRESESAFTPLDWSMGYAGCTSIEYKQDSGEWEQL